ALVQPVTLGHFASVDEHCALVEQQLHGVAGPSGQQRDGAVYTFPVERGRHDDRLGVTRLATLLVQDSRSPPRGAGRAGPPPPPPCGPPTPGAPGLPPA